jgi:hypothetical protein
MDDVTGVRRSPATGGETAPTHAPRAAPTAHWPPYAPAPAPARGLLRRLAGPAAAAAGVAAVTAYIGLVDPNEQGHYPTCPFLRVTGLYCPGCGGLRCVHALAHGDLPAALALNAFAVAMVPLIAWIWLRWTVRSARGRARATAADPRLIRLLAAAIVVFAVLRNLPFGAALAP